MIVIATGFGVAGAIPGCWRPSTGPAVRPAHHPRLRDVLCAVAARRPAGGLLRWLTRARIWKADALCRAIRAKTLDLDGDALGGKAARAAARDSSSSISSSANSSVVPQERQIMNPARCRCRRHGPRRGPLAAGDIGVAGLEPVRQPLVDQFLQGAIDRRGATRPWSRRASITS